MARKGHGPCSTSPVLGEEHDAQSLRKLLCGPLTKRRDSITNPTQEQSVGVPLVTTIKGTAHKPNKKQIHSLIFPTHEKVQDFGPQRVTGIARDRQQPGHKAGRTLVANPPDGRST